MAMKKKKRRQQRPGLSAPPAPRPKNAAAGLRIPPPPLLAACALSLLACFAAALGGISEGVVAARHLFNVDSAYLYKLFRDIFLTDLDVSGFRLSTSPMLFPDMLLFSWPLHALGIGWHPAMLVFILTQTVFGAVGWMLVCARLGGGAACQCAALLAWAAQILGMAYGAKIFIAQAHGGLHFGAWVCAPWLLWLALPDNREKESPPSRLIALALALAVCIGSDLLVVIWFAAPAAAAAALLFLRGRWSAPCAAKFLSVLALGSAAGALLRKGTLLFFTPSVQGDDFTSFNPEKISGAADTLVRFFVFAAGEYRLLTLVWLAFAALALLCLRRALSAKSRETNARTFVLAYMPAMMILTLLAIIAVGNVQVAEWTGDQIWVATRYFTPVLFLPLFVGWAVPPVCGFFARPPFAGRERAAIAALAAALALVAAPKIAAIQPERLSPYNTPFHRCVSDAAKSRGWRAAIGSIWMTSELMLDPDNGIERELTVLNPRHLRGQLGAVGRPGDPLWVEWTINNRHQFNGEFDFAIVNLRNELYFRLPGPAACSRARGRFCGADPHAIDGEILRRTFGEPSEILECDGVGIFAYDPPVRVDMSEVPDWGYGAPLRVLPREQ